MLPEEALFFSSASLDELVGVVRAVPQELVAGFAPMQPKKSAKKQIIIFAKSHLKIIECRYSPIHKNLPLYQD